MIRQLTWVVCDEPGCDQLGPDVGNGAREEARLRARDLGWQWWTAPGGDPFPEHLDLCPKHVRSM